MNLFRYKQPPPEKKKNNSLGIDDTAMKGFPGAAHQLLSERKMSH
jgi:hypothetical protein